MVWAATYLKTHPTVLKVTLGVAYDHARNKSYPWLDLHTVKGSMTLNDEKTIPPLPKEVQEGILLSIRVGDHKNISRVEVPQTIMVALGGSAKTGWTNDLMTIQTTPRGNSSQKNLSPFLGFRTTLKVRVPVTNTHFDPPYPP